MSAGPDEPTRGHEYPSLEDSTGPVDPYAPVDYPTDSVVPPNYGPPPGFPQPGPPMGYPPPGPPMGYPPPGYPPPYPGTYGYAYDPYAPQRPPGTNGKAIAALVTSLGGLFFCGVPSLVGFVLGIIAMRETKRTGQEGHGMALAGVIVGALAVVGWVLYVAVIVFAVAVTSNSPTGY